MTPGSNWFPLASSHILKYSLGCSIISSAKYVGSIPILRRGLEILGVLNLWFKQTNKFSHVEIQCLWGLEKVTFQIYFAMAHILWDGPGCGRYVKPGRDMAGISTWTPKPETPAIKLSVVRQMLIHTLGCWEYEGLPSCKLTNRHGKSTILMVFTRKDGDFHGLC